MSAKVATSPANGAGGFCTTRWSVIRSSGRADSDDSEAHHALAEICRIYWRPIYAYIFARKGSREDAEDLTQEFFARMLETGWLRKVDESRGRFRSFLLTSLNRFLADETGYSNTMRRGRGFEFVSWDGWMAAAPSYVAISNRTLAVLPEDQLFDLRWAVTVTEQALHRLAEECEKRGRRRLFERLSCYLTSEGQLSYAAVAGELGITEILLKRQIHAIRRRYRWLLREEVERTVRNPADVDEEIRNLCAALAASAA